MGQFQSSITRVETPVLLVDVEVALLEDEVVVAVTAEEALELVGIVEDTDDDAAEEEDEEEAAVELLAKEEDTVVVCVKA